jgi:large subunit ribosomal protein L3
MLVDFFATKLGMTQAWTKAGKRLAVTRCKAPNTMVIGKETVSVLVPGSKTREKTDVVMLQVAFGKKKLKNMSKPLRSIVEKAGFTEGAAKIRGTRIADTAAESPAVGSFIALSDVLEVGDVVQVQGTSKGRGFAGAVKRYGFHGGPKTHGQSDRHRAVGSIGAGTTPGRVFKGKRMPGHYGDEAKTVTGLVVVHVDQVAQEVWLSGPVPGSVTSSVRIRKTGEKKTVELDTAASQIRVVEPAAEAAVETPEVQSETAESTQEQETES